VPTLLELSSLYERRHQLADARAAVDEALQRDPNHEAAQLQQAILDRRLGQVAEAESKFQAIIDGEVKSVATRAQAAYELAQLLDEQQRYDEAFATLTAAKLRLKPYAAKYQRDTELVISRNAELLNSLDQSVFDRWRDAAKTGAPYRFAVLTSHPRSGTTLIEQVLDSHDELISADEFDVYSEWIHAPIFRKFRPGTPTLTVLNHVPDAVRQEARATYWKQTEAIFGEAIGSRMLLDKNPAMTIGLPVVNWAFPEMKILFPLRDPRDVILSCFMQKVPLNQISSNWLSLADAVEYYACAMRTWLKVRELTPSPFLEFRYEQVVTDLESEARRILDFLGLPWNDRVLRFYEHAREKVVRSPTYKDVTKPIYQGSVGRWQHYAKYLEPVLPKLQPFLNEFGYGS
jgi:tetratricopeptide (TPR) repeat protein